MNLNKMKLVAISAETGLMAMCLWALLFSLSAGADDFSVREYGAVGDGKTFDTEAVQRTIDACSADGGGRVVLEKGVYLVKPIMLKSGVDLHIARNARLLGFGWGKGGDHANSANPFHNCKGFTFNACTFDDCDNNK